MTHKTPCCHTIENEEPSCPGRRDALKLIGAAVLANGGVVPAVLADGPADLRPTNGDHLVPVNADTGAAPIKLADIVAGQKPVLTYPLDPSGVLRDGSRLNKVLLVRMDPATLSDEVRARSADGVLGFSAICTHAGCEVSEWSAPDKALLCFCHFSKFSPAEGGKKVAGPAPRSLPYLPLRVEGDTIVVDGEFSAPPGGNNG